MRAVVQRVSKAQVSVNGETVGAIGPGICVLLGVGCGDSEKDAEWLADKIAGLRIFDDEDGKMNRSLLDVGGDALLVSQFTLYGDCRKGRRPSFVGAADPGEGRRLYELFVKKMQDCEIKTACGVFQAHMQVELTNDGPVTLILDTSKES